MWPKLIRGAHMKSIYRHIVTIFAVVSRSIHKLLKLVYSRRNVQNLIKLLIVHETIISTLTAVCREFNKSLMPVNIIYIKFIFFTVGKLHYLHKHCNKDIQQQHHSKEQKQTPEVRRSWLADRWGTFWENIRIVDWCVVRTKGLWFFHWNGNQNIKMKLFNGMASISMCHNVNKMSIQP